MTALAARTAELAAATRPVLPGRGAVLVGAAGVGKTALAAAVADEVAGHVGTVVWTVATAAGRTIPFGALAPLLPPEMATVHPALVPNLVGRRLAELASDRPALLVVDDARQLDEHSAAALLALVTGRACRTLATVRTGAGASDAVVALWKDRLLDRLDLGPLNRAGARALLADGLGGGVASGTVELLWAHSRGNPLYLSDLVRFGVDTGRLRQDAGLWWWSGDPGVPPRLGELLARRLDELTPAGRDAVDLLALGEPLPWATMAAVVPAEAVLEADERGLVSSDEQAGVLQVRFGRPRADRRAAPRRPRAGAIGAVGSAAGRDPGPGVRPSGRAAGRGRAAPGRRPGRARPRAGRAGRRRHHHADPAGTGDRPDGRPGPDRQGDRGQPGRLGPHGREPPGRRVPQARHPVPAGAFRPPPGLTKYRGGRRSPRKGAR